MGDPGDRRPGTYAEYVSVPTECLFAPPAGYSAVETAALPLVGVTTYRGLFARGRLQAGENLLVLGAGGGVATMATALATAAGANVFVTSSAPGKVSRARENGAVDGVLHTDADWPEQARRLTPRGEGFDVVLDSVGDWSNSLKALRPGGRLVVLGASKGASATIDVRPFYFGQYELIGTTMGSPRDLRDLLELIDFFDVPPPVIDSVFPLDSAREAHDRLASGSAYGKIVLANR
ncbi:zinc-binding dehydrogenase [Frondihabitans sp. PAMC 28766]|uniref:zinc-binding dehydrogenase n=1 Tax=Frondihabitans sp. PAMC 28766 TaxID=1795630 RepID=UPI000ACDDE89|nr:zinc-binding dehydrogenase [Frondihabitans sp. PAMC 28766]